MGNVIYSLNHSLDGYAIGPDGGLDWGAPDAELFRAALDEVRAVDVHLLGRRLYEAMSYWHDPAHEADFGEDEREFARVWRELPKLVFSTTLTEVTDSNTTLAAGSLFDELTRLRDDPAVGDIAIGGPRLAASVAAAGLLDEYRPRVHPVILGGGTPFYAPVADVTRLDLISSRVFGSGVVASRYRVRHPAR